MVVAVRVPTQIVKRSGETVPFDKTKIENAIIRCYQSIEPEHKWTDEELENTGTFYADKVINVLSIREGIPTVESVQDIVVFILQSHGEYAAAEHYIIYRHEHTKLREAEFIPQDILDTFQEDQSYFPTQLQRLQFYDKYSRFNYELGRRETWIETVDRGWGFLRELAFNQNPALRNNDNFQRIMGEVYEGILNMKVMPAMRLMAMAGPAARRNNATIYNCSYLPIDSINAFCELMSNSMDGCGVGFSVEFDYIDKLPKVQKQAGFDSPNFVVEDSEEGWIAALRFGLNQWISGLDVHFDTSLVRPKGTPLKTKGGRASGPEPLKDLLAFIRERILSRQGKKLTTLDVHDICCAIGNAVVSGGVRRTALISIFDPDDEAMLNCKSGDFATDNKQRWNANNSAVIDTDTMNQTDFVRFMWTMFESKRGEPGIFARNNAVQMMPERRNQKYKFGTNPCGEINLRPRQFCNLTDVIARKDDTFEVLAYKVRLATIIGTIQSCATYFPNLPYEWKRNCEEERLLGVGLTGQLECDFLRENPKSLSGLREIAVDTNKQIAEMLGINQSASITCVKPNGNSSVLFDCSSGLHARWAQYYLRNVRITASSPLVKVLQDSGYELKPELGQDAINPYTWVVGFPVKSPEGAVVRDNWDAIDQCEWWLENKLKWTEHNPSVTIYYTENEIIDLLRWLWDHKSKISGMSFLPRDDAKYDLLPYVTITEDEYNDMIARQKPIKFERIYLYEKEDFSTATQEAACTTDICELPNGS